jgi:hypothetical protein
MSTQTIPRLAYGKIGDVHVRIKGDIDDSGVQLVGVANTRLWRVHERCSDGTWILYGSRGFHNDMTVEAAAKFWDIVLYGDAELER